MNHLNQRGISLVGVLISIIAMGLIALYAFRGSIQELQYSYDSFEQVQAMNFARESLEYVAGRGYAALCNGESALAIGGATSANATAGSDNMAVSDVILGQNTGYSQLWFPRQAPTNPSPPPASGEVPASVAPPYNTVRFFAPGPIAGGALGDGRWQREIRIRMMNWNIPNSGGSLAPLNLMAAPVSLSATEHSQRAMFIAVRIWYPLPSRQESNPAASRKQFTLYTMIPLSRNPNRLTHMGSFEGLCAL
jgi:hypothetical protein